MSEICGRSGQQRKGSPMHGNHCLWLEQPASISSLFGTHGEKIANWQQGEIRPVEVTDDLHVAEDIGVSGVVNFEPVIKGDHVATGFAAIDNLLAILDSAGMIGLDHCHLHIAHLLSSALVHGRNFFYALLLHPEDEFVNTYYFGIVFSG